MMNPEKSVPFVANPRRSGFKWSVAAGLLVLALSALFIATNRATAQVVEDGIALSRAEAALGANGLALKALAQAVLLAEDNAFGVAGRATLDAAISEAEATLEELESHLGELIGLGGSPDTASLGSTALVLGDSVLAMIEAGRIDDAGTSLAGEVVEAFKRLRDDLADVRADRELALSSTGAAATRFGDIVTFLVGFLLPLGAILAYRYAARRQLHTAEVQLDARLEAEREVVRARDEFIGNISHELRTPLTSIFGFSELLLESGAVDPTATLDLIGLINMESAELARMVEDLVVSARVEANALAYKNEFVDIEVELESVLPTMRYSGAEISVQVTERSCWGDPVRVRQVLRNLLSNAQRYGGPDIRVTSRQQGDMLEITVADNGAGVPAEMEPRLFTRFVHGGREALMTGSVGLGLSVVGSLTKDMGGSVSYDHSDEWARFTVRLPLDPSQVAGPDPADPVEEASAAQAAFLRQWLRERNEEYAVVPAAHDD